MRLGVLTSSRADFGIYLPLLNRMRADNFFELKLIVFGSHLSQKHGYSVSEIISEGFLPDFSVFTEQTRNDAFGIADNYADYTSLFGKFWNTHAADFNMVLTLGDRYEMTAAVMAGIPFGVKFAHIHAGETTLGAIDNIYRHCITLASSLCFTSTDSYKKRAEQLVEPSVPVYNVGALSLDGLKDLQLPDKALLAQQFGLDFSKPLIMVVFHPETVHPEKNKAYIRELLSAIESLPQYAFAINMPNADMRSDDIRQAILDFKAKQPGDNRIAVVEHFGKRNYFACLKYSALLLGNSSSGIIEAASFGRYVINLGDRQKGRVKGDNVFDSPIVESKIMELIIEKSKLGDFTGKNIYEGITNTSKRIVDEIKKHNFVFT